MHADIEQRLRVLTAGQQHLSAHHLLLGVQDNAGGDIQADTDGFDSGPQFANHVGLSSHLRAAPPNGPNQGELCEGRRSS